MTEASGGVSARRHYLPILQELLPLHSQVVAKGAALRSEYDEVGHIAHGWFLRCLRGIVATLRLDEFGFAEEAAPLRRSVIEHVLALRWLAAEGNQIVDTVARGHALDAEKRGAAASEAGWVSADPGDIERVIGDIEPERRDASKDHLLHFAHRLAAYGDGHTKTEYLAEVARSHPSYESAAAYFDVPGGALRLQPRHAIWQVPWAATHLLEALLILQSIFEEPSPWENELEDILGRFKAVTDEVRREDGLPAVDWSTGTLLENADQPAQDE